MSQVAIEKVDGKKATATSVMDEMKDLSERIRQRAFEFFERRGGGGSPAGSPMDDWLSAERELFRIPESELLERDGQFEARVSAPGFAPDDVQVVAMPDALIVKARSTHRHDQTEGDTKFCEFDQKTLFRRLDLPEPINVDRVTANLEKGVLQLTAAKSKPGGPQNRHSIAA